MSDRAALLAAIIAHPDEDTPRLVYADWLDEHGDSRRAAFIRARIEHHRLAAADTATNALDFLWAGYTDAVDRVNWAAVDADLAARLAARKADEKLRFRLTEKNEGVPRVRGVRYAGDERGFFDAVIVDEPAAFLKHAATIFRAAPITTVHFMDLTAEQAEEFVAAGHLARLRELHIGYAVESGAVRVFGAHADAAGVRKLELGNDEAGEAVEALADGKHWTGLEYLDLSCLEDGDESPEEEQLARLFARPPFRNLRKLNAWSSSVDDDAVKGIVRNLPELRELDLSMNPITDGARLFAAAKNLRHLRALDLSSCDLEGDPAPLLTAPNLPNLNLLRLDSNDDLAEPDPKVLAKSGRGPGLRVLELDHVKLTGKGVEALVKCPALSSLWYLGLGYTGLGDEHLERFTRHAAFDRLVCLQLGCNSITARGAKALAAWPGAANLQWLDLVLNSIGDAGAKALAASPHLAGLKHLSFNGRGSAVLKKRFKKAFA